MSARLYASLRAAALSAACAAALWGCDAQNVRELQPGVATEANVRARFGAPEAVWDGAGGARIFEYNRQPAGQVNYQITLGTDGRMAALDQVLAPAYFARVQPGMAMEDLRRLLGRPARVVPRPLQNETEWEWRYLAPPNRDMVFTAVLSADQRVLRSGSASDSSVEANRK